MRRMLTALLIAAGAVTMGNAVAHGGWDGAGWGNRGSGPEAMGRGAHGHGWHHHGGHRYGSYGRRGGDGPSVQGGGLLGGHRLAAIKSRLELTAEQEAQWTKALAESRRVADTVRDNRRATREAVRDELAKAEPDLAKIAAIRDEAHSAMRAEMSQARDLWLQLYATFSPAQKSVVKEAMTARQGGRGRDHRHGHRHSGHRHSAGGREG